MQLLGNAFHTPMTKLLQSFLSQCVAAFASRAVEEALLGHSPQSVADVITLHTESMFSLLQATSSDARVYAPRLVTAACEQLATLLPSESTRVVLIRSLIQQMQATGALPKPHIHTALLAIQSILPMISSVTEFATLLYTTATQLTKKVPSVAATAAEVAALVASRHAETLCSLLTEWAEQVDLTTPSHVRTGVLNIPKSLFALPAEIFQQSPKLQSCLLDAFLGTGCRPDVDLRAMDTSHHYGAILLRCCGGSLSPNTLRVLRSVSEQHATLLANSGQSGAPIYRAALSVATTVGLLCQHDRVITPPALDVLSEAFLHHHSTTADSSSSTALVKLKTELLRIASASTSFFDYSSPTLQTAMGILKQCCSQSVPCEVSSKELYGEQFGWLFDSTRRMVPLQAQLSLAKLLHVALETIASSFSHQASEKRNRTEILTALFDLLVVPTPLSEQATDVLKWNVVCAVERCLRSDVTQSQIVGGGGHVRKVWMSTGMAAQMQTLHSLLLQQFTTVPTFDIQWCAASAICSLIDVCGNAQELLSPLLVSTTARGAGSGLTSAQCGALLVANGPPPHHLSTTMICCRWPCRISPGPSGGRDLW